MATTNLFEQLENFLPQHVSPLPSYLHASLAFVVAGLVTHHLGAEYIVSDLNRDGRVSEAEARAKRYVQIGASLLISLFVADTVFSASFTLRGIRTNRKHLTYRRWFPSIYY